ncbi:MAG: cytochrome c3 family protein [Gemmatimonadota bacterium]|nr:MAG: cytochrome c3 family protein [Gemmatimonadota bacterium]
MLLAMVFMATTAALAQGPQEIAGSAHDFRTEAWAGNTGTTATANGDLCVVCHTPHNGNTSVLNAPLWNHAVSSGPWDPYVGTDLQATVGDPDGSSVLCLSCHDGSVALDSYGGQTGSTTMTGAAFVDTDLTNDHPVSFVFNAALAVSDGTLWDPEVTNSGLGGTIQDDMLDSADKVQCASCHTVHNESTLDKLLKKSNDGSALCTTCHAK